MAKSEIRRPKVREKSRNLAGDLNRVESLGFAGGFSVLGLVLTYLVRAFGLSFVSIAPMHIPLLFAGGMLSPIYALCVGLVIPAISTGFIGFPQSSQSLTMMTELTVCSLSISLLWKFVKPKDETKAIIFGILFSLIGVIAGILVSSIISALRSDVGTFGYFLQTSLSNGGIALLIYSAIISPLAFKFKQAVLRSTSATPEPAAKTHRV